MPCFLRSAPLPGKEKPKPGSVPVQVPLPPSSALAPVSFGGSPRADVSGSCGTVMVPRRVRWRTKEAMSCRTYRSRNSREELNHVRVLNTNDYWYDELSPSRPAYPTDIRHCFNFCSTKNENRATTHKREDKHRPRYENRPTNPLTHLFDHRPTHPPTNPPTHMCYSRIAVRTAAASCLGSDSCCVERLRGIGWRLTEPTQCSAGGVEIDI